MHSHPPRRYGDPVHGERPEDPVAGRHAAPVYPGAQARHQSDARASVTAVQYVIWFVFDSIAHLHSTRVRIGELDPRDAQGPRGCELRLHLGTGLRWCLHLRQALRGREVQWEMDLSPGARPVPFTSPTPMTLRRISTSFIGDHLCHSTLWSLSPRPAALPVLMFPVRHLPPRAITEFYARDERPHKGCSGMCGSWVPSVDFEGTQEPERSDLSSSY